MTFDPWASHPSVGDQRFSKKKIHIIGTEKSDRQKELFFFKKRKAKLTLGKV